jgi:small subunit ribosomal protein S16
MVVVRLRRTGETKQPSYRLVVTDKPPRDSRVHRDYQPYNPIRKPKLVVKGARALLAGVGAQPPPIRSHTCSQTGRAGRERQSDAGNRERRGMKDERCKDENR